MFIFGDFGWGHKVIFFTVVLIISFIVELFVIKYTNQKSTKKNKSIFIGSNEENPEKFLLENYRKIKNSGRYENMILISGELEGEKERICQIFSKEKGICYINISEIN